MKFILLLIMLHSTTTNSPATMMAEFDSVKACETAAQNLIQKIAIKSDRPVVYTCDPKG